MHILLIILLAFIAFVILLLIAALFITKSFHIECEIIINKPRQVVFDYIKLTKNQQYYNKWWMIDPAAKKTYSGKDGTIGFIAAWDSQNKQAGKGEQEIVKVTEGKLIGYQIRFKKPFESVAASFLMTTPIEKDETLVKWGFNGTNKYPINLMFALLNLKKTLGNEITASLEILKNILEATDKQ